MMGIDILCETVIFIKAVTRINKKDDKAAPW